MLHEQYMGFHHDKICGNKGPAIKGLFLYVKKNMKFNHRFYKIKKSKYTHKLIFHKNSPIKDTFE